MAITTASHPPPSFTVPSRYENSFTVSTSPHNFSSCSTASLKYSSHFLKGKVLENIAVTLMTLLHLLWIILLHCTHKTELAFTDHTWVNLALRQAILYNAASDHHFDLEKVNFKTHALKSLLPFHELIPESINYFTHQDYIISIQQLT